MKTKLLTLALIAVSLTFAVNCSGVRFETGDGSSGGNNGAQGNTGGDAGGGINQPGGNNTGGNNPGGNNPGGDAGGGINQPGGPNNGGGGGGIIVGAGPNGGDISNGGGAPGPVNGVGNTPSMLLPKVQFIGPECVRLTNCAIIFRLDKPYAQQTEFNWRTDDTLFGKPAAPGGFPWGMAGYHYVSTSGHVVFAPGQTEVTVYVRNINPENTSISIGVIMSQCTYSGLQESCQKFFQ